MPSLSGSTLAPTQSRFNTARFGATRFGYFFPNLIVKIGGTSVPKVRAESIEIEDESKQPARASFTVREGYNATAAAEADTEVIIALGADQPSCRLFRGAIFATEQTQEEKDREINYHVTALGDMARADQCFVNGQYTGQSATAIFQDLVSQITTATGVTFTSVNVQSGLATIDSFSVINQRPSTAFNRLVALISGRWYWDGGRDLHAVTSEAAISMPTDLTTANSRYWDFTVKTDRRQFRTQVVVEGQRTRALTAMPSGTTDQLPVEDASQINSVAGTVRIGAQTFAYSGTFVPATNPPGSRVASLTATGATRIYVTDYTQFNGAGWAKVGDQIVRYHNLGNSFLDDVPASGYGSLQMDMAADTPVTRLGHVTLTDAATYGVLVGDDVIHKLTVDDAAAQATQGIRTVLIQDSRLSYAGAVARANAELSIFKNAIKGITYKTRDPRTRVGRTIATSFSSPTSVTGTFTIKSVRVHGFDQRGPRTAHHLTSFPILDVEAAPVGFLDAIDVLTIGEDSA